MTGFGLRSGMDNLECTWDEADFHAAAVYTGENRMVRVWGTVPCPRGGYELHLERDNEGVWNDPDLLVLGVREVPPSIGTDAITDTDVEDFFEDAATRVEIRELGITFDVEEPG